MSLFYRGPTGRRNRCWHTVVGGCKSRRYGGC